MPRIVPTPIAPLSSPLPDANDPATYGPRGRAMWAWETIQLQPGANLLADQGYQNAVHAEDMAALAEAATYLQGNWADQSGAANKPYAVYHNGSFWALLNNLANVATSEPGVTADWAELIGLKRTGDEMTGDLTVPSLNSGQLAGMRNVAVNGDCEVRQSGDTFVSPANDARLFDMWAYQKSGAFTSFVSTGPGTTAAMARLGLVTGIGLDATVPVASPGATDFLAIEHRTEGINCRHLREQTFTISFWVYATVTGTYCVSITNLGRDPSRVQEFTVNASNTWEYKTVTFTGGLPPSLPGQTFFTGETLGIRVRFCVAAGANLRTTGGVWTTGNYYATANQVNGAAVAGQDFAITGLQIERGAVATPYEKVSFGLSRWLCERYYEVRAYRHQAYTAAGQNFIGTLFYKQAKPASISPVVTFSGTTYTNASGVNTTAPTTQSETAIFAIATALGLANVTTTVTIDARL